jgi:AraC family transcriptional regulator, regulatory protein of adaptative response / methylated-DNA-[protein]-cysteine methyltransferase
MLDFDECNAARLRRDPDYDGRFFIGVKTTGIYCRPVCPVRQPLTKNVTFHPSAAAAEKAGFRPCLRCRPETAPFCPAWNGTRTTVERAMKLIADGALDGDGTVEALSDKLGIGPRQLTRLFARHLGASPVQFARSNRIQRAKRLIDETAMPMAAVAKASGFGSLRRFNAAFSEIYRRPPTALRRRIPRSASANEAAHA